MGDHDFDQPPAKSYPAMLLKHEHVREVGRGGVVGNDAREAGRLFSEVQPKTQRACYAALYILVRDARGPVGAREEPVYDPEVQTRIIGASSS